LKIAICDDDIFCRELLMVLTRQYNAEKGYNLSITAYEHGNNLLEDVRKTGGYDIYILDIMMPDIDGIRLGLSLRELGFDGKILYLTSSEEYALDAFKARAYNYILKPIEKNTYFQALEDAIGTLSSAEEKSLIVKTKEGNVKLDYSNILYADLDKRAVAYHLIDKQTVIGTTIRTTFAEAVQELSADPRFVMCGASMIVNLSHITIVENNSLLFDTGNRIYIAKRAGKELLSIWQDYLG